MPKDELFGALDRYYDANTKNDMAEGVVQNISGATAMVRLNGSERIQEAWYAKGANLMPGDRCIMVRTSRNSRWIVLGGFGTAQGGASDLTPFGGGVRQNVVTGGLAQLTAATINTTHTPLGSLSITTTGGIILVGASYAFVLKNTTYGWGAWLRFSLDGGPYIDNYVVLESASDIRATSVMVYPFKADRGTHLIECTVWSSGSIPVDGIGHYFWAAEV